MRCNLCGKEIEDSKTLCDECNEKRNEYLSINGEKSENNDKSISNGYANTKKETEEVNEHIALNKTINILLLFEILPVILLYILAFATGVDVLGSKILILPIMFTFIIPIVPVILVILSFICKRMLVLLLHLFYLAFFIYIYI